MKIFKSLLFLTLIGSTILFIACTDEDDPFNPIDDRDVFLGTWNVNENCIRIPYQVEIVKDPSNSSQVLINNFWLIGPDEQAPYAIVAGTSIVIPEQGMCNDGKTIAKGSGNLGNESITWEYTVNDGADLYTCTATYEKP